MYQVKKVHYIEDLIEDQKILLAGATLKIEVDYMEEYEKKESAAIENGIYVSTQSLVEFHLSLYPSESTTQETDWIYYLFGRRVRA